MPYAQGVVLGTVAREAQHLPIFRFAKQNSIRKNNSPIREDAGPFQIIGGDRLPDEFRALTGDADTVRIAVPFWGQGAIRTLGLTDERSKRIVCNLSSTAWGLKGTRKRAGSRQTS